VNRIVTGLLDAGTGINVIGGKLAEQIIHSRVKFKSVFMVAHTAYRRKQDVIDKLKTEVIFKDVSKALEFHIVPSLGQELYLGIHFWNTFDLLPPSMQVSEIVSGNHILSVS